MPEHRIVLQYCEIIDSKEIESYLAKGGFQAWKRARERMTPQEIIDEVKASGLLGRGGAAFQTGLKWELARNADGARKYLICNADEGEIGTFKDRYMLRHDPFSLIEGMAIAGLATGVEKAILYLRAEYNYLSSGLKAAIEQAKSRGFLDHMEIEVFTGAGAYICGEESALMNSIEGLRGEARWRPPFPSDRGLFQQPTVINNVETLMNVPRILLNGASWFNHIGTERSKGTKVFSVSGDVARPGVYEMVMGISLRELVKDIAGAEDIKAVQIGGAAGRILPYPEIDITLSYETVLGSGGVFVLNNSRDPIDLVFKNMKFLNEESCGKCTPCREGTEVMVEIYNRLLSGEGTSHDVGALHDLAQAMLLSSLCGLGQSAPIPVLDSLEYFRDDYDRLIAQAIALRSCRAYPTGHLKNSGGR